MKKSGFISAIIAGLGIAGVVGSKYLYSKEINLQKQKVHKFKSYYTMLNQWLLLKQQGKTIDKYFIENNIKTVAVYGVGEIGEKLINELNKTEITVKYAIDKNAGGEIKGIDVLDIDDELEEVDAIIVTPIFDFENIKNNLEEIVDYNIISLEEVFYGI